MVDEQRHLWLPWQRSAGGGAGRARDTAGAAGRPSVLAGGDAGATAGNPHRAGSSPAAGQASRAVPTTCPHSWARSVSRPPPPAAPPSGSSCSRCPPPSSPALWATTTKPPPVSSTKPAVNGADTPPEITQGHCHARHPQHATVDYAIPSGTPDSGPPLASLVAGGAAGQRSTMRSRPKSATMSSRPPSAST